MRRHGKRRGVSLGTIIMLVMTLCVAGGFAMVMPRLTGSTSVDIDAAQMLDALSLSDILPELSLSDIPINGGTSTVTSAPTTAPTGNVPASGNATAAPTAQPQATATPAPQITGGSFTMTMGGSISITSAVRKSAYVDEAKVYDFSEMISLLTPDMQTDMCMVSLENLVDPSTDFSDTVVTDQALPMLTAAGIDAVALGFPRAYDRGMSGLANTINALTGRGITVLGAFSSAEDAQTPRLMTLGGVKVAVLHYTDGLSSAGSKKLKSEGNDFAVPQADAETIQADMTRVKQAGAQVIVVSLNWGSANKTKPTSAQTKLAQQLADAGADVIVGTGSDVVQTAAWLTGKRSDGSDKQTLCVYSLGSLLSDSRDSKNVAGMLLQLRIAVSGNGEVIFEQTAYTPTYIWHFKDNGKSHYRVLPSDQEFPSDMSADQQKVAAKALKTVQTALNGSPLTVR